MGCHLNGLDHSSKLEMWSKQYLRQRDNVHGEDVAEIPALLGDV